MKLVRSVQTAKFPLILNLWPCETTSEVLGMFVAFDRFPNNENFGDLTGFSSRIPVRQGL